MHTAPVSSPTVPREGWDRAQTGHALFRTRLGVCGIAWGAQAVVALRLPKPSLEATQMRLLEHARQRREGLWPQVQVPGDLSAQALQAVAGVQWLLAGREGGSDPDDSAPWPDAPAPVLGDLRSLLTLNRWSARSGLPLLDDVVLDWHGVPDFSRAAASRPMAARAPSCNCWSGRAQRWAMAAAWGCLIERYANNQKGRNSGPGYMAIAPRLRPRLRCAAAQSARASGPARPGSHRYAGPSRGAGGAPPAA